MHTELFDELGIQAIPSNCHSNLKSLPISWKWCVGLLASSGTIISLVFGKFLTLLSHTHINSLNCG